MMLEYGVIEAAEYFLRRCSIQIENYQARIKLVILIKDAISYSDEDIHDLSIHVMFSSVKKLE